MAGSATIGSLRVVLGADTAAFSKGLKQSEKQLSGFAGAMKKAGPIIATALGTAVVGLGVAIRRTIDDFDDMSKASQKVGVGVEELSRLRHAAELSGVEFGSLSTAMARLNRNMLDAAGGTGEAQKAFGALGISVEDSDGKLKTSSEIMSEVAERFQGMTDGAAKTGLAMQIFGRAGAELIPLLNSGASGIQKLKDEADALGITINTEAARSAEQFNDNLSRMGKLGDSLTIGIVNEWAPALADLSEVTLNASKGMKELTGELGSLIGHEEAAVTFFDQIEAAVRRTLNPIGAAVAGYRALKNLAAEGAGSGTEVTLDVTPPPPETFTPIIENQKQLADATRLANEQLAAQNEIQREAESLLYSIQTPVQQYQSELQRIGELHKLGAIDSASYQQAVRVAAERSGATWQQASESIAGSFAQISGAFGDESSSMAKAGKAFGAIQAAISMWTGAAKALELPFPANLGAMAAVLATGAGLVANIKGAKIPNYNQGADFTVGGMGGIDNNLVAFNATRGERVQVTPADEVGGLGGHTISIEGIDPLKLYSGTQLREFMGLLYEAQKSGTKLVPAR